MAVTPNVILSPRNMYITRSVITRTSHSLYQSPVKSLFAI